MGILTGVLLGASIGAAVFKGTGEAMKVAFNYGKMKAAKKAKQQKKN